MISMELPGIQLEHGYVTHGHSNLGHTAATLGTMGHGHLDPLHSHPHHQSTAIIHHALINSTHNPGINNEESKKKSEFLSLFDVRRKLRFHRIGEIYNLKLFFFTNFGCHSARVID